MNTPNTPVRSTVLRLAALGAAGTLLSACAAVPGWKMDTGTAANISTSTTAQMQTAGAEDASKEAQLQSATSEIDVALIRQLRDESRQAPGLNESLISPATPYVLGPGDVLQITVWDHPELAAAQLAPTQTATRAADPVAGFVIDQRGDVMFPYAGRVHVAGLTAEQAQAVLVRALGKSFVEPQVTLRVASYRASQIYIDGEIHTPGPQPINDIPMGLYEAISRAGGFSPTADQSRMVIVRDGVSHPINLSQMLERGQNPSKIVLKSGDVLRVPARDESGVFVMGEVNKPTTAMPMRNGKLSLSDALAQAGSVNLASSNPGQVYVIRDSLGDTPKVFHLDAKSPVAMILANQFDLQPHDVVYVDSGNLVRFSRVLSLLMPAINAGLTAAVVAK
ncbi:MAG: polysaccharide biosynthesis/export family protein [Pseudomonadota bacterium]|uniref:polysaccharide biosynthesis/export family protein n=1 Tax=Burkholderia sp. PAMC 28687 TaxID=1795874 RepID=UPI0009E8CBB8|nr:polysaccharide biosynthesis/export family protein [Burkholderia sp. PAMC 28687]MDP9153138.1 polysaccharide biosynthesis/export family protein [Pseudomonadota bacterium]